jgi:hypothetical protein
MPLIPAQVTTTYKAQRTMGLNRVVAFPSVGTPWARQTMLEHLILITPLRAEYFQSSMPEMHQLKKNRTESINAEQNRVRSLFN